MRRLACIFVLSLFGVIPAAFGQVTITVDAPSSVQLGIGLKYVITVTNTGASSVGGVVVTDNLPGGLSATSVSSNCAGTTTVICDIGDLAAGQNGAAVIETVPQAAGSFMNAAMVTGGNSASVTTNVISNGVVLSLAVLSTDPSDVVTSSPAGLNCNGVFDYKHRCFALFPAGSNVTLTESGPNFLGWKVHGSKSACLGAGPCTVTMTQEQRVDANFVSPIGFALPSFQVNGPVNFPFSRDLSKAVLGGIGSIAPYTYSIAAGSLPTGLALSGSVISGTPTVNGVFPVTVQLQDSSTPPQIATFSLMIVIVNAPNTQQGLLNGQYALLFRGASDADSSGRAVVASLTFDGNGGVTGVLDSNGNGSSPGLQTLAPVSGTYSIGPDNRGLVILNNGSMIFAIAVGEVSNGVASAARIIRFDDNTGTGTRGAGEVRRQDPTAFAPSSFAGTYVYGLTGERGTLQRLVEVGLLSMDNAGNVGGGPADINNTVGVFHDVSIAGTYSTPTAAGRTTLNLIYRDASGLASPFSLVGYVVDANNLFLMSTITGPIEAGTAERQANPGSFTNSSLAGPDVINLQGPSGGTTSSDSFVLLGTATFASPTASLTYDSNNARIVQIQGVASGPYSVAPSGLVQISVSGSPAPPITSLIAYLIGPDHGFVISAIPGSNPDPFFGEIDLQRGGPFVQSSFAGSYFFGDREPASPSGGPVTSGVASADACTINHTSDQSRARGELTYDVPGSFGFAVSPGGRITTTFAQSNQAAVASLIGNLVGYVVSPIRAFFSGIDPAEHHPEVIESRAISPTPAPTIVSITVNPPSTTIGVGGNRQYSATGIYSDGSVLDLTSQVNWISSNLNAAPISATGLASGAAAGAANILVSLGCLSSNTATLTVTSTQAPQPTSLGFIAASAITADFDDAAQVQASLAVTGGSPIPNETVKFSLGSAPNAPTCSAKTDATGTATCLITPNQAAGQVTLTATFVGDSSFGASSASTPFTVTKEQTTLKLVRNSPIVIANGQSASLSAMLQEDGTTPISGRSVTITLGSGGTAQSCTETTNASGVVACNIVLNQPLGPSTASANFAGDGFYLSASDSEAILVFAFLGSGSFVIGNLNAVTGNNVDFWGAQWASFNSLTGGMAPDAFKGFAVTSPQSCGGIWTSDPGNSSNPPTTVPSYMAVMASSSIIQSGTVITGDAPKIVIISTNPGYGPAVGHAGSGTVVAVLCVH
jgi:uncharacterized repeat protein (TIGR01451 family)